MDAEEAAGFQGIKVPFKDDSDKFFSIGISAYDCTGCGSCADVCPARVKALEMVDGETNQDAAQADFDYLFKEVGTKKELGSDENVRKSQFLQPLLEFSGACPGCGETPYAKLVTQLFGDRMFIANATGCSSIWGLSAPASPYTVNAEGKGPAWGNSLFEDNAEFGYGMAIAMKARRAEMQHVVERLAERP